MKKILFLTAFIFLFPVTFVHAKIVGQAVEYQDGETLLEGYLAYDDEVQEKRPAVIVVHEWKGLNDYAKKRAGQLAQMGYVAFAADIYGKGILAKDHAEAGKLAGMYKSDRSLMRGRAKAAYELVKNHPLVEPSRVAAIGYCFGGTTVLEMARAGMDLKGVASFHGGLDTPLPAQPGTVKAKILVFHGGEDKFISEKDMAAFQEEMKNTGADWQLVILGGAVHAFTVPDAGNDKSTGVAYNEAADKRSWRMMKGFFKEIFK